MKTSQSYIARIEGGKVRPSTDALERFAQATRTRLRIIFEPQSVGRCRHLHDPERDVIVRPAWLISAA